MQSERSGTVQDLRFVERRTGEKRRKSDKTVTLPIEVVQLMVSIFPALGEWESVKEIKF